MPLAKKKINALRKLDRKPAKNPPRKRKLRARAIFLNGDRRASSRSWRPPPTRRVFRRVCKRWLIRARSRTSSRLSRAASTVSTKICCASVLHPDATIDMGPGIYQGTGNDYVQWVLGVLANVKSSHHLVGNVRVTLEGDCSVFRILFPRPFPASTSRPAAKMCLWAAAFSTGSNVRPDRLAPGRSCTASRRSTGCARKRCRISSIIRIRTRSGAIAPRPIRRIRWRSFRCAPSNGRTPAFLGRRYESKSVKF